MALLYQTVVQKVLPTCPSIHLMVIGEEEKEGSLCANNTIHTEVVWNEESSTVNHNYAIILFVNFSEPVHSKSFGQAHDVCNCNAQVS